MKWVIELKLIFDDEYEAKKVFKYLKGKKGLLVTINRGRPNEERSRVSIHKCYHDEDPSKPCEYLEVVESAD